MSQNCASVISLSLLVTVKGKKATLDKTSLQSFALRFQMGYIIPLKTDGEIYGFDLYNCLVSVLQSFQFSPLLSTSKLQGTQASLLSFIHVDNASIHNLHL